MKRLAYFGTLFLCLLAISSCQKGPYLSISGDRNLSFTATGGNYRLSFSSNRDWFVTISEPWCTVTPSSGVAGDGEIAVVITCEPNTAYDARSCVLDINIEGAKESITIEQAAAEGLILSQSLYELTSAAQDIEVTVLANVEYTVTIDSQSEKWITRNSTKSLSSNKLTFSVFENTEYDERTGHITITQKDGNLKGEITVRQAQKDGLFVNTQDYVVSEEAQSLTIDVNANIQYEVLPEVEWINYVETKALKESSVILNVGGNSSSFSRTGKIIIRQDGGSLSSVINVTQQARPDLKTENATGISFFGATLNGRLTVESMAEITSEVWFLYSSTASSLETLKSDGVKLLASLTDNGLFTKELSGLNMASTYYFVACARVNGREYYGEVKSFVTSDFSAAVNTKNATDIDFFTGKLNGILSTQNAEGFTKDVWFLYSSSSTSLEQLITEGVKATSSLSENGEFGASLTELNYGTEYYYVACAKVHDRTFYGDVRSFTTSCFSATVTTASASCEKLYNAIVRGSVSFENISNLSTSAGFLYSESSSAFEQLKENGTSIESDIDLDNCFKSDLSKLKCGTQYYFVAWVKVYDKVFYGSVESFTSKPLPEGAVDMGLSVAWATKNIGASTPEEYGYYYAWGEVETKEKNDWSTYKWGEGEYRGLTKYNNDKYYGSVDGKMVLDKEDDVARYVLGGDWRMPNRKEFNELIDNCVWTWMEYNGVNGYKVTSKINGNVLFFPAAGCWCNQYIDHRGEYGDYLGATLYSPLYANVLVFEKGYQRAGEMYRCYGYSVRAISE